MPFSATNKMPNVYIEEVNVPGPIPGVSTSAAGFVGPALAGPTNEPLLVTNWTQFVSNFGSGGDPYILAPQRNMAHAVKGFFDNGGAMAWISRAGTGVRASLTLLDGAGKDTLIVRSRSEGGNGIQVTVTAASVATTEVAKEEITITTATAAGQKDLVTGSNADAAKFKPGDKIRISDAANNELATVASIANATITLSANLTNAYANPTTARLADLEIGQKRIRLKSVNGIEKGTYLKLTGVANETGIVSAVEPSVNTIELATGLSNAYSLAAASAAIKADSQEFTLKVDSTTYANLSMDTRHSRHFSKIVDEDQNRKVDVAGKEAIPATPPPGNLPAAVAAPLAGGAVDDPSALNTAHYLAALSALEKVDEVSILCIPDAVTLNAAGQKTVQDAMVAQCIKLKDRFAVLDPPAGADVAGIKSYTEALGDTGNGYAAMYYPRLVINHPGGVGTLTIPPSGHVAGLYARVDDSRGVHKAPANESLLNVAGLETQVSDEDHGPLNEKKINVIRAFPGRGIRVWGARTLASSTQWRYINVRRLLLFIEESIQEGTQFAVFEPNNQVLWQRVKRTVNEFLDRVWKSGALLGEKADEAYRVRIDDELNPPATMALGQLIIEVRVAPTTPAEFVVFQIVQEPGRKIINE